MKVFSALLLTASAALAAGPAEERAWLDLGGETLRGEAADPAHTNWIVIRGFGLQGHVGEGQAGEFELAKGLDLASPGLFRACAEGRRLPLAKLDLLQPAAGFLLCRLELADARITRYETDGPGGGADRLALSFAALTYTYHTADTSVSAGYDFVENIPSQSTGPGPDIDADLLPDAWEDSFGLVIGTDDAGDDPDGDGLTNREEFLLGTDPRSGASFFRLTIAPTPGDPESLTLSWNSVPGKAYNVLFSADLTTPFAEIAAVDAVGATTDHLVPKTSTLGFYRVNLAE